MLIFYTQNKYSIVPVVVIDSMSSDDRFTTTEIQNAVFNNAPGPEASPIFDASLDGPTGSALSKPRVYSCEYSAQFEHVGIPLGSALKTRFSASLKSPPADLISYFAPIFLNSSLSISQMSDPNAKIPNIQTAIIYAAMVVVGGDGTLISRKFIVYSAPLYPDTFGTIISMVLSGAMVDDLLIKSANFCRIDKKTTLAAHLRAFLSGLNPALKANFDNAPTAQGLPATEKLFPPMKLYTLLSEICLQNKLLFKIDEAKKTVIFYGVGQKDAPKLLNYKPAKFSFLGSVGYMAWALGIENFANIKFKSALFDCILFNKITVFNDIGSVFFGGLVKNPSAAVGLKTTVDAYDAWIIRYVMKWSRQESVCEVTASNNWIMSQFRIDGLIENAVYMEAQRTGII